MEGSPAWLLSNSYTKSALKGVGALKGAPCSIKESKFDEDGNTIITFEWQKTDGTKINTDVTVLRGKSAYEIAVDNGFVGTEKEWLDSLRVKVSDIIKIGGDQPADDATQVLWVDEGDGSEATEEDLDDLWNSDDREEHRLPDSDEFADSRDLDDMWG